MKAILFFALLSTFAHAQEPLGDCDRGSANAQWGDMRRDLKAEEETCLANRSKGIKPQVIEPTIPANADDATIANAYKASCYKGSREAQWDDMRRDLMTDEETCVSQKVKEWKTKHSPSKAPTADCQLETGVALRCPEGVYKFIGNHDLEHVSDQMLKKEMPGQKKKESKASSAKKK